MGLVVVVVVVACLLVACLLDAQAPPWWSNNFINRLKYYVLQLGDPHPHALWEPSDPRRAPPGFRFGLELPPAYTVLSGHGEYDPALGHVHVPPGTQLFVFGTVGSGLTHGFANILESGDDYEIRQFYTVPHKVFPCITPPTLSSTPSILRSTPSTL